MSNVIQKKVIEKILIRMSSYFIQSQKRGKIFECQEYEITSNLNLAVSVCVKCHTEKSYRKDFD